MSGISSARQAASPSAWLRGCCRKDYRKLTATHASIVELLAMPGATAIDFESPRLNAAITRPADLS